MSGTPNRDEALRLLLRSLKLPAFQAHWSDVARQAEDGGWTFGAFLHHLAEVEVEERRQRRVERLLQESQLPHGKTLAALDDLRLPTKVRRVLPRLCDGDFTGRGDNILIFGLPGRGKTH